MDEKYFKIGNNQPLRSLNQLVKRDENLREKKN